MAKKNDVRRWALIKDGEVANVIDADRAFFDSADPAWLALWDRVERVEADDGVVEPGSRWRGRDQRFQRIERGTEKTRDQKRDERLRAVEAALGIAPPTEDA